MDENKEGDQEVSVFKQNTSLANLHPGGIHHAVEVLQRLRSAFISARFVEKKLKMFLPVQ